MTDETKGKVIAVAAFLLFIAGRGLDDAGSWTIPLTSIQISSGTSMGFLALSLILFIVLLSQQIQRDKFLNSLPIFLAPWGLAIVLMMEIYEVFGCRGNNEDLLKNEINKTSCNQKVAIIVFTNLIHHLACMNTKQKYGVFNHIFSLIMCGEIIYHCHLLPGLVNDLTDNKKFHSVFYVAIMIMWRAISINQISSIQQAPMQVTK